jgi:hypothetical protein
MNCSKALITCRNYTSTLFFELKKELPHIVVTDVLNSEQVYGFTELFGQEWEQQHQRIPIASLSIV